MNQTTSPDHQTLSERFLPDRERAVLDAHSASPKGHHLMGTRRLGLSPQDTLWRQAKSWAAGLAEAPRTCHGMERSRCSLKQACWEFAEGENCCVFPFLISNLLIL